MLTQVTSPEAIYQISHSYLETQRVLHNFFTYAAILPKTCKELSVFNQTGHPTSLLFVSHHVSPFHIQGLTLGRWLHSDLVAEVTPACSGDGCSPDQVLLPVVEMSDSVEQQLWIGFILAGQLGRAERGKERVNFLVMLHLRFQFLVLH